MIDRYVCSDASMARGEPVVATASVVRAWLLIEVPGAWGVDAIHESELGAHVPPGWKGGLERRGIRPLCVRSPFRERHETTRVFFAIGARPGRNTGSAWMRTVPSLGLVPFLTDELAPSAEPEGWERHDGRLVLVCTNGRHDQCCANRGRPVVRHLRESRWSGEVWESSHVGGDRFAPNLVVLPDGLYFGRMEPEESEAVLDRHAAGELALDWYRGRSTLRFVEQAVEHAVRERFDVGGVDDVAVSASDRVGWFRAHVAGVGTVDVRMSRTETVLTEPLTCTGTPNQVVPEYRAEEFLLGR